MGRQGAEGVLGHEAAVRGLLVGYRQRWDVTYLRDDLVADHDDPVQGSERDAVVEAIEAYTGQPLTRGERARDPERQRDLADDDLSLDL